LAIARAGRSRLPRFGTLMLIASGVAPDLDYASYFAGASAFLQLHRGLLHSLAGAGLAACAMGAAFCELDKRVPQKKPAHKRRAAVSFRAAAAVCGIGFAGHILLDSVSGIGVRLLWPFSPRWFGWPISSELDLWLLLLLVAGLLLPLLFGLVREEVGERRRGGGSRAGIVTFILVLAYLGARGNFHAEAVDLLLGREYHGRVALAAGAFPESSQPFEWRGIAVTDDTIEEAEVPVGPGSGFDPERSLTHYKPPESAALEAAQATATARRFLVYAKFPLASVEREEAGYRVEIHDLRFEPGDGQPSNIFARVELNSRNEVTSEGLRFASSPGD
jgi:inner membrane protein